MHNSFDSMELDSNKRGNYFNAQIFSAIIKQEQK